MTPRRKQKRWQFCGNRPHNYARHIACAVRGLHGSIRKNVARRGENVGGAEEDLLIGGRTSEADAGKWLRSFAAYVLLVFSLGLFYSERWIAAVILLVVFVVLLIINAPQPWSVLPR